MNLRLCLETERGGGIEADKADPSNGRPVAALSRPLIHIECQGSASQSLDS